MAAFPFGGRQPTGFVVTTQREYCLATTEREAEMTSAPHGNGSAAASGACYWRYWLLRVAMSSSLTPSSSSRNAITEP